jgi:hypothetical protein
MPIDDCKHEIDLRFKVVAGHQLHQLKSNNCFLVLYEQDEVESTKWKVVGRTVRAFLAFSVFLSF